MMKQIIRTLYLFSITLLILCSLYLPNHKLFHSKKEKSLNVIASGGTFSPQAIKLFEKESGIKVNLQFYSTNEELLTKMKETKGEGIDILFPSDYGVKLLSDEGLIKPLEKDKIDCLDKIEPYLLNHEFDPNNHYSIPYAWEVYGIAANQKMLSKKALPSLAQLFEQNDEGHKIIMPPHPLETTFFAAYHLFGKVNNLTQRDVDQIRSLLKDQKRWTEAYADFRATHLITSEICPLALLRSSYLPQVALENSNIDFLIPKEGIFTSIDSLVIGTHCKKDKAVYQFINFFYKPEIMALQVKTWPLFPANLEALDHTTNLPANYYQALKEVQERKDLLFFHYFLSPDHINKLWLEVKVS